MTHFYNVILEILQTKDCVKKVLSDGINIGHGKDRNTTLL